MNKVIDRVVIILLITMNIYILNPSDCLYLILTAIIYTCVSFYLYDKPFHFSISILAAIPGMFVNSLFPLLALIVYESVSYTLANTHKHSEFPLIGIISTIYIMKNILFWNTSYIKLSIEKPVSIAFIICALILAVYLSYYTQTNERDKRTTIKIRDDSEEMKETLVSQNRLLTKQQNDHITMATLQERNRIAREIHDNVGHLITRSIMQLGALRAVYTDEPLATALSQLSNTLDESMNNIRSSVHDLHNDSFDLKKSINDLAGKNTNVTSHITYSLSANITRELKYCFYSIITEAYQNIQKHSDADNVYVDLEEHNAFYKLVIKDNGTTAKIHESGIGLHNMESRIHEMNGTISFTTKNGFQIFISIPKKEDKV